MQVGLKFKRPETDEQEEWCLEEMDRYVQAVGYMAFYLQKRASFGDQSGVEIFDEFRDNVCEVIRRGTDSPAGEQ